MIDKSNREIKHIRLSVTTECNYDCIYCDKEGIEPTKDLLTIDEIERIARVLAQILKVKRIKVTGGEPLCRKNIVQIVKRIHDLHLYDDISITTNGFRLHKLAQQLLDAGLNRLNVSLCSLNPSTYQKITGSDSLNQVLKGIYTAKEVGLYPIKLNYVILKGLNDGEFEDFINFCSQNGLVLQLIELHETVSSKPEQKAFYQKYYFNIKPILEYLNSIAKQVITREEMQNRKIYVLPNNAVVETITPSHEFCMGCTKLRIGCDGNLFGCLYRSDLGENLKTILNNHDSLDEYENVVKTVVSSREPYF